MSLIDSNMVNTAFLQKLSPELKPLSFLFPGKISSLAGPTQQMGMQFTPMGFEPSVSTDFCHPQHFTSSMADLSSWMWASLAALKADLQVAHLAHKTRAEWQVDCEYVQEAHQ
jgi:hypothetical protein